MSKCLPYSILCAVAAMVLVVSPAQAHVFPDRSMPRVGSVVDHAPDKVRIWFGGTIEKQFSRLRVKNAQGKQVSKGDGRVTGKDDTLLETDLPHLSAGKYHVYWTVVGRDGHRTMGDFSFTVKGQ